MADGDASFLAYQPGDIEGLNPQMAVSFSSVWLHQGLNREVGSSASIQPGDIKG